MSIKRHRVIQSAEKLVRRGKLEAAIAEYRKVLDDSPNDTRTLNRVGDLYARLDRMDRAVDLFTRAAEHFTREGFFVKAIAIYKKIIRQDPTRIQAYETLADLYSRQGLINESRSQYQVVADYFIQQEDLTAAIAVYRKMVELESDNPSHRVKLADLYRETEQIGRAMEQYREIAALMLSHQRVEDAARVYQSALELDSSDLGFVTDAVLEIKERGKPEAAERLLAIAIERNPEAERVLRLIRLGREAEGEAAAPRAPGPPPPAEAAEPAEPALPKTPATADSAPAPQHEPPAKPEPEPEPEPEERTAPPAAPAPRAREAVEDEPLEFELDLDQIEAADEVLAETETFLRGVGLEEAEDREAPREELEKEEVAETVPARAEMERKAAELLAEGQVLATYGLEDKAIERYEQVLGVDRGNMTAFLRMIELHVAAERPLDVVGVATRAAAAADRGADGEWREIRDLLGRHGFRVEGKVVVPPRPEPVAEAPAPEIPVAAVPQVDDSELAWLEEITADRPAAATSGEEMFGAEEEFFDLAAELEEELKAEETLIGEQLTPRMEEQSLEEIVEGFKRGVAETLSEEDYDTHYNLGIAYREMGLIDEAIGEFQLASKDPRYLVDCCSLLGNCFLEKGFEDLAVKWYRRGLEAPRITEDETLGLLYELGNLHMTAGDPEAAHATFVEIYGINSNYRDVVAKLEELRSSGS